MGEVVWGVKKGQDRVEKLAQKLDDRFQLVIVGIDGKMFAKKIGIKSYVFADIER